MSVHNGEYESLLTIAYNDNNKSIDLHGVVNLLIMLLFITNLKNILTSFRDNGFTLKEALGDFIKSKVGFDIPAYSYPFAGILFLGVFIIFSFWIEVLATTKCNRVVIFVLIA